MISNATKKLGKNEKEYENNKNLIELSKSEYRNIEETNLTKAAEVQAEKTDSQISGNNEGTIPKKKKTIKKKQKKKQNYLGNAFWSYSSVEDGYYGKYNEKGEFTPLGKEISIESVIYCLETEELLFELAFDFSGKKVKRIMERGKAFDPKEVIELNKYGADCPTKNIGVIIDTFRQRESFAPKQIIHKSLGWFTTAKALYFRADELYGGKKQSYYDGSVDVKKKGTFEEWKNMVVSDVLGHVELETLLVSALSSVVIGLISDETTKENPIIHYSARSGSGKTSVACLMASTGGKPFHGCEENQKGERKTSLLQSWSTTSNAIIADQSGNTGYPIIIDELSKIGRKDLSQLVYSFSEGTQKKRMTSSTDVDVLPSFRTTVISLGECQLLSKCRNQNIGLKVRVLELTGNLTMDAEHSRRIKQGCSQNYGFAIPKIAEHIIAKGKKKYVLDIYEKIANDVADSLPDFDDKERVSEKFIVPIIATAKIASKALDIDFSIDEILCYLLRSVTEIYVENSQSELSYEAVLEHLMANQDHIFSAEEAEKAEYANKEQWGCYRSISETLPDGKTVVGEYSIRKNIFEKIISDVGYENVNTVCREWRNLGYLSTDGDRFTRKRKIDAGKTALPVYVIRVFDNQQEAFEDISGTDYTKVRKNVRVISLSAKEAHG